MTNPLRVWIPYPLGDGENTRIRSAILKVSATSCVTTTEVAETFKIADRILVFSPSPTGAKLIAQGTPQELQASGDPFVRQFLDGQVDGPVRFHYPATPIAQAFGLEKAR